MSEEIVQLNEEVIKGQIREVRGSVEETIPHCARLRHVAGTQWGNKKYMNIKLLEAVLGDPSIAG